LLPDGGVDFHRVFLVPTGLALAATVLLMFFFKPPTARPDEAMSSGKAAH
jgi:hypothetical protein